MLTDDFARFWAAYPRRVGKQDALKAWQKLKPDAELVAQMIATLGWQVNQPQWQKDDGQFVPYPASWLRAGCWDDEPFRPTVKSPAETFSELKAKGWAH